MTNKQPVVGKRYKAKKKKSYFNVGDEMEVIRINYLDHLVHFKYSFELFRGEGEFKFNDFVFWEYFEELPEDKQTASKENHNCILSKEVLEAIEELRKEFDDLGGKICDISSDYQDYFKKSQKLLNALDNQFKVKLEITDGKIQTDLSFIIDTEKSDLESLPNSISEIDELQALVHHQNFSPELVVYLEGILDQHNSLLDRVERLEQMIGDKK